MDTVALIMLACVIIAAIITLGYVFILFRRVSKLKVENPEIENVSAYIRQGAMAFLKREFIVVIPFILIVAVVLLILGFIPVFKDSGVEGVGWQSAICFIVGALFSALAGFIGMVIATKANARTADVVKKEGISGALKVAFSGGSVLGLSVVGFGILGLSGLLILFYYVYIWTGATEQAAISNAVSVITGYGLGCSMLALFGRVGGGIYTKAADVGADLVGKIEAGIPEDDPRNPAVIADNVGDNVGDVAGMGSDLTESFVGAIISAVTLASTYLSAYLLDPTAPLYNWIYGSTITPSVSWIIFPIAIAGCGALASLIAVIVIRSRKWKNPQKTLSIATYVATGIVLVATILLSIFYLKDGSGNSLPLAIGAIASGLVIGIVVGKIAEYYTSSDYKEVREIARESQTGDATNIIAGFGSGMKSTGLTILVLAVGIIASYFFFGEYGIALAAVGMLSTCGITVAVDAFGPISDNAGGIAEMAGLDPSVREVTDKLDSVGNTTAAIGKGFCISAATLTSLSLFVAFAKSSGLAVIDLLQPEVIISLLIGAMLPYFFSSLVIGSVGKAANKMIEEVRRQFKADPGILQGTSKPDYAKCVDISTKASLREMIIPGVIAVLSPIVVGFVFGVSGLGGLLIGGLASAIMLAVFMANSGGAWDNAKKYIEEGNFGGKGSQAHKAAITGDTVGDPFKDTAGPSMDILIKLMSIVSLIIGPAIASLSFGSLWDYVSKYFATGVGQLWAVVLSIVVIAVIIIGCGGIFVYKQSTKHNK